jgi:hypothetical protein
MEEKFRRKVWAGLFVIILGFGIFCAFLTTVKPERVTALYIEVDWFDSELDALNISDLRNLFNETAFLENYSIGPTNESEGIITIRPIENPDIVITLCRREGDIYFYGEAYNEMDALSDNPNYLNLKQEMLFEISRILEYVGHGELAEHLEINPADDNDFIGIDQMIRVFAFFSLLALIIVYCSMMVYQKGNVLGNMLENAGLKAPNDSMIFGLLFMYFSTGMGLMDLWFMVTGQLFAASNVGCLVVCGLFLILGIYLIVKGGRKLGDQ